MNGSKVVAKISRPYTCTVFVMLSQCRRGYFGCFQACIIPPCYKAVPVDLPQGFSIVGILEMLRRL